MGCAASDTASTDAGRKYASSDTPDDMACQPADDVFSLHSDAASALEHEARPKSPGTERAEPTDDHYRQRARRIQEFLATSSDMTEDPDQFSASIESETDAILAHSDRARHRVRRWQRRVELPDMSSQEAESMGSSYFIDGPCMSTVLMASLASLPHTVADEPDATTTTTPGASESRPK